MISGRKEQAKGPDDDDESTTQMLRNAGLLTTTYNVLKFVHYGDPIAPPMVRVQSSIL